MRSRSFHARHGALCLLAIAAGNSAARASDKPVYAPVPDWVKPAPVTDAATLTDASPILLVYDFQQRLQGDQSWTYVETAKRVASNEALQALGTITFPWQPEHGDLIVHRVEIIRGTERIDLLKDKQPFSVLRRESQMEQFILDGQLSATMPVEGLRVGDVLRVAVSLTLSDPTLKGHVQTGVPLLRAPFRVDFARTRFIWPKAQNVRFKSFAGLPLPATTEANGYNELLVSMPLPKDIDLPQDAPVRFQHLPLLEGNDFADWAQVSAIMAPLYATEGLIEPNGPIAAEIARIMHSQNDPLKRAAAALQLVQDQIRYQLIALDTGNYVPQAPVKTWSVRYGDCKAKTLLLLAMLQAMGIEAEPVLASSQLGGLVADRLPSAGAFDHIFVHARIGGDDFWLDGTGRDTRLADIRDVPRFETVLPVRLTGGALMSLPRRADARPTAATEIILDSTAGLRLPSLVTFRQTFRGQQAQALRLVIGQATKDDLQTIVENVVKRQVEEATIVAHQESFDDVAGTATLTASGIVFTNWAIDNDALTNSIYSPGAISGFSPDRARTTWQMIPVSTGAPSHRLDSLRTLLPAGGKGFVLEGDPELDVIVAGQHVVRHASLTGNVADVTSQRTTTGEEIPVAAIGAQRKIAATLSTKSLRLIAPVDYPLYWEELQLARRLGKTAAIAALYTQRIAQKPEEGDRYAARATFYAQTYEREKAIADLTKAISLMPTAQYYAARAAHYRALGQSAKAIADARQAIELDLKTADYALSLAALQKDAGDAAGALALLQERIDLGGLDKNEFIGAKAETQAETGDVPGGLALVDAAIVKTPGNARLLNVRCWIKATQNVMLDTALKDCSKAIELSDSPEQPLDSRAMVYFRLGRNEDALADLKAALLRAPEQSASLFLRAIIRRSTGDKAGSDADLAAARGMDPQIDKQFRKFGIVAR